MTNCLSCYQSKVGASYNTKLSYHKTNLRLDKEVSYSNDQFEDVLGKGCQPE